MVNIGNMSNTSEVNNVEMVNMKKKVYLWSEIDMASLMTWRTLDIVTPIEIEVDGDSKSLTVWYGYASNRTKEC